MRRLCLDCRKAVGLDDKQRQSFAANGLPEPSQIFETVGCSKCRGTGFYGRCGIFEAVTCDGALSESIASEARESDIRLCVRQQGVPSLAVDALTKVSDGITSMDEALSARWF